jgi:outer membrane murein-binding lipoprotein Lpp
MSKAILSATITLAVGSLFIAGCATKNYVKQSITPVDQKIDQVDKSSQTRDQSQVADISKTNQTVDEDEKKLSATDEIAKTADRERRNGQDQSECEGLKRFAECHREY